MDFQQKLRHTPNVEDEYGNTPAQRAELDWLLYNKPFQTTLLEPNHEYRET